MIGRLTGRIVSRAPGRLLVDVSGVGYDVQIPLSTFYALSSDDQATVSLHVHTYVREEALQLYGFASVDERTVFERLIAISGVGPRMALAILSGIGVDEMGQAVRAKDRARLQKIPGVGKKTAERLLLELADKLRFPDRALPGATSPDGSGAAGSGPRSDAVSALVNLGYSNDVARKAVERAAQDHGDGATLQKLLRVALAGLVR